MKNILLFLLTFTAFAGNAQDYERTWATYFGGNSFILTKGKADHEGNIYLVGYVVENEMTGYYSSYTTPGAHQPNINGGQDGVIAKFSPQGNLLWSTYFGTEGEDRILNLDFDASNNLFICGYTLGTNGIVTVPPDFTLQTFPTSSHQGFLAAFSPQGTRLWGKYIEGVIRSIAINDEGSIYGIGVTKYQSVATPGAFDNTPEGIQSMSFPSDQFIAKYSNDGTKIWATYYGLNYSGSFNLNNIGIDSAGNVFVEGANINSSESNYFATPDCFENNFNNSQLSFLSKFTSNGVRVWSTYYGGELTETDIYDMCVSGDNIYFCGVTTSSSGISTAGSFQPVKGGLPYDPNEFLEVEFYDGFLTKFDLDGNRVWGTYYGGDYNDAAMDVEVKDSLIYLTGTTRSQSGIASNNAYQQELTIGGGPNLGEDYNEKFDAFFAQFDTDGNRNWSTYYGGSKSEGFIRRHGIIASSDGAFFLFGGTSSENNIATPDGFQPALNVGIVSTESIYNFYLSRFDLLPLAIDENTLNNLQLFPNPNNGSFTLQGNFSANTKVAIFDIQGRKIYSQSVSESENAEIIDLKNQLNSGVYVVKIFSDGNTKSFKMLVD